MQGIRNLVKNKAFCSVFAALCLALPFFVPSLFVTSFLGAALLFCTVLSLDLKTELRRYFRLGFGFAFVYHLLVYHWLLSLHPLVVAGIDGILSLLIVVARGRPRRRCTRSFSRSAFCCSASFAA